MKRGAVVLVAIAATWLLGASSAAATQITHRYSLRIPAAGQVVVDELRLRVTAKPRQALVLPDPRPTIVNLNKLPRSVIVLVGSWSVRRSPRRGEVDTLVTIVNRSAGAAAAQSQDNFVDLLMQHFQGGAVHDRLESQLDEHFVGRDRGVALGDLDPSDGVHRQFDATTVFTDGSTPLLNTSDFVKHFMGATDLHPTGSQLQALAEADVQSAEMGGDQTQIGQRFTQMGVAACRGVNTAFTQLHAGAGARAFGKFLIALYHLDVLLYLSDAGLLNPFTAQAVFDDMLDAEDAFDDGFDENVVIPIEHGANPFNAYDKFIKKFGFLPKRIAADEHSLGWDCHVAAQ